jgi:hypothetical protein
VGVSGSSPSAPLATNALVTGLVGQPAFVIEMDDCRGCTIRSTVAVISVAGVTPSRSMPIRSSLWLRCWSSDADGSPCTHRPRRRCWPQSWRGSRSRASPGPTLTTRTNRRAWPTVCKSSSFSAVSAQADGQPTRDQYLVCAGCLRPPRPLAADALGHRANGRSIRSGQGTSVDLCVLTVLGSLCHRERRVGRVLAVVGEI